MTPRPADTASFTPNRGRITSDRASALAVRGGAIRRARRNRRTAARLEAKAADLLSRAATLRLQATSDLAAVGVSDG